MSGRTQFGTNDLTQLSIVPESMTEWEAEQQLNWYFSKQVLTYPFSFLFGNDRVSAKPE